MSILLALLACAEETGPIGGTVLIGPGSLGPPLAGGTVVVLDEVGEPFDTASIDDEGRFDATAPLGGFIHVRVEGPGMVPAGFSGRMGLGPFEVEPGTLFGWPESERAAMDAQWGDCARPGSAMIGEVRLFGVTDDDGVSPLITTAFASIPVAAGQDLGACYLDDESGLHDPTATTTGPRGTFAIFDIEPGIHRLDYGYHVTQSIRVDSSLRLYVPDGGVTPLFPAWVDLYMP